MPAQTGARVRVSPTAFQTLPRGLAVTAPRRSLAKGGDHGSGSGLRRGAPRHGHPPVGLKLKGRVTCAGARGEAAPLSPQRAKDARRGQPAVVSGSDTVVDSRIPD